MINSITFDGSKVVTSIDINVIPEDKLYNGLHANNGDVLIRFDDGSSLSIKPIDRTGDSRNLKVELIDDDGNVKRLDKASYGM